MMADAAMRQGKLVPDHLMIRLIMGELKRRGWVTDTTPAAPLILSSTAAVAVRDSRDDEDDDYVTGGGLHSFAAAAAASSSATTGAATAFAPTKTATTTTTTTAAATTPSTILASDDPAASFILDGFPRTLAQAQQLDALAPPNLVVELCTPAPLILARLGGRLVHAPSGRVYHAAFSPPRVPGRDDATGEPLTRRADDDEATWRARLARFERASRPLLAHYARRGVVWRVSGDSSDEISPRLFAEVARRFGASAAAAASASAGA
jgi:adenylate kinase